MARMFIALEVTDAGGGRARRPALVRPSSVAAMSEYSMDARLSLLHLTCGASLLVALPLAELAARMVAAIAEEAPQ